MLLKNQKQILEVVNKGMPLKNKAVNITPNFELEKVLHEWFLENLEKVC